MDYRRDYSLGIDYWALGCIVFELERAGAGVYVSNLCFFQRKTLMSCCRLYSTPCRNWQPIEIISPCATAEGLTLHLQN